MKKKYRIKKFDLVKVTTGSYKGVVSQVIKIDTKNDRVFLKDLPTVRRHIRPNALYQNGVIEKSRSVHISNVAAVNEAGIPSKVLIERKDGTRTRILKKHNTEVINLRVLPASEETADV